MSHTKDSRNPSGLATRKPISLRLMPVELDNAERIAKTLGVTKSKLARDAYLAGLPLITQVESSSAETSSRKSAELSGGDDLSPVGLSSLAA